MLNDNRETIENSPLFKEFAVEFYGYNFNPFSYSKKTYIKPPFVKKIDTDKKISLSNPDFELFFNTINSDFFSTFNSDRYKLYDVSFRTSDGKNCISLNFNDVKDGTYLSTEKAFAPFNKLDVKLAVEMTQKMKDRIFDYKPNYNPISMIGLLYCDDTIEAFKSYIRFNDEDFPSHYDRLNLITRILNIDKANTILSVFERLDNLYFKFSFIGVDCNDVGNCRLKLYFRYYGLDVSNSIWDEISIMLKTCGLYSNMKAVEINNTSGIWGLAISISDSKVPDGLQLYLYPKK